MYVIFNELEVPELDGTTTDKLVFIHLSDAGPIETLLRSRASEFSDPKLAYQAASRYPQLIDWRVGKR